MRARILYIEDNEQNLYLVAFILEKRGYEVLQARDGFEGIEMALREKPDLILLDFELPVMDGYEVLQRLRAEAETREVPIIALTSYAMAGDRERFLEAGCTGYIEKPIDTERFLPLVEQYLQPGRREGDGGS